jgi:deoxycytidine triphosphate deaminase
MVLLINAGIPLHIWPAYAPGQITGRLAFGCMAEEPDGSYGRIGTSNYQGQELKLSKHFA